MYKRVETSAHIQRCIKVDRRHRQAIQARRAVARRDKTRAAEPGVERRGADVAQAEIRSPRIGKRIANRGNKIPAESARQRVERVARRAQPERVRKIDGVVAGVGVPVVAVLGRVFADEAACVGSIPTGPVVVEAGVVVPGAAGEGDVGVEVGDAFGGARFVKNLVDGAKTVVLAVLDDVARVVE